MVTTDDEDQQKKPTFLYLDAIYVIVFRLHSCILGASVKRAKHVKHKRNIHIVTNMYIIYCIFSI